MNFGSHIQNQNNNIVKNTGAQDANGFDEVEKFFATIGLSEQALKNRGGNILQQSELLSNLGINHSVVKIDVEKNDKQSL